MHFFFFNDTATTDIYTLSLHDALPIFPRLPWRGTPAGRRELPRERPPPWLRGEARDRKSTRLNSSHLVISYAVFCLKKKKTSLGDRLLGCWTTLDTHVSSSITSDRRTL